MDNFIKLPDGEVWVKGYEGLYSMNIKGEFYSYYKGFRTAKKVHTANNNMEYPKVRLRKNGKDKAISVHRLIMLHFVPNPDNKPCVNHKDGNKSNYEFRNLEWVTYSENIKHAVDTGLKKTNPLTHYERINQLSVNANGIFTKEEAEMIIEFKNMFGLSNKKISVLFNCSENVIRGIVKKETNLFRKESIFIQKGSEQIWR